MKRAGRVSRWLWGTGWAIALVLAGTSQVQADAPSLTATVNTTADTPDTNPGDGTAIDAYGKVSLRALVQEANAFGATLTVTLPAGTYLLTGGSLPILVPATITGGAAADTILDAQGNSRLFDVQYDGSTRWGTLALNNLTLQNGSGSEGGAIRASGSSPALTLAGCIIQNCQAVGDEANAYEARGGAVYADGVFAATDCSFRNNQANAPARVVVTDPSLPAYGGALFLAGSSTIVRCQFTGNSAKGGDAGPVTGGSASGGAIQTIGSSVTSLTLSQSSLTGNTVGGGFSGMDTAGDAAGGAIGVLGGGLDMALCTLSGNIATGGSTMAGSSGNAAGAGLYVGGVTSLLPLTLRNCTITANSAATTTGSVATGMAGYAGVYAIGSGTPLTIESTIIAGNSANGSTAVVEVFGSFSSSGHNLVGAAPADSFIAGGDQAGSTGSPLDAKLAALADNGGGMLTHALLADSPALDAGASSFTYDQRGLTGPCDGNSDTTRVADIGALEMPDYVVTETALGNVGSLDQVIARANLVPGSAGISFSLTGSPPFVIQPTVALPAITEQVTILAPTTGTPIVNQIVLDGSNAPAGTDGLRIVAAGSCRIVGLNIRRFSGNGISISGGSGGNVIEGCSLGTDETGSSAMGNGASGIAITDSPANVLGEGLAMANVISGNNTGITIAGGKASGNQVIASIVGLNRAMTAKVGNTTCGIQITNAAGTVIGGPLPGEGHDPAAVIAGNGTDGIKVTGSGSTGTLIQRNYIGTNPSTDSGLGNSGAGIAFAGEAGTATIGGANLANVIADNGGAGIVLQSDAGTGIAILANSLSGNGGLGIDLGGNGATANDHGDADLGPNNLMNSPELLLAGDWQDTVAGMPAPHAVVIFRISSWPSNANYEPDGILVQFFKADANGQGRSFLGQKYYDSEDFPEPHEIDLGDNMANLGLTATDTVVATATDSDGNTSEFSAPLAFNSQFITVTNTADDGTGSLRQVVGVANSAATPVMIDLQNLSGGTINLLTPLPALTGQVAIVGNDDQPVTIARSAGAANFRLFEVASGANAKFFNLKLTGGVADWGGGIRNAGTCELTRVRLSGCQALGDPSLGYSARGGGIYNAGTLSLTTSAIEGCTANPGQALPGDAGADAFGGALCNEGTLSVLFSSFTGNTATGGTGGSGDGQALAGGSAWGGGLSSAGQATIYFSLIAGNTATGGTGGSDLLPGSGGMGRGAGLVDVSGHSTLVGCTVANNRAVAGTGGYLPLGTTPTGNGGEGRGAGIEICAAEATLISLTIADNAAELSNTGSSANGGGIYTDAYSSVGIVNTIVARNTRGAFEGPAVASDVGGSGFTSGGHNLIQSGGVSPAAGDIQNIPDAKLGTLADNGGKTLTIAPLPGSPVIDAGDNGVYDDPAVPLCDQRENDRIVDASFTGAGAVIDIGAYELRPFLRGILSHSTITEAAPTNTATLTIERVDKLAVPIQVTGSDSPAGVIEVSGVESNPFTIAAGVSQAVLTVTAIDDSIAGGPTRTATLVATSPDFAEGVLTIAVTDGGGQALTLAIDSPKSLAENAGPEALGATVSRPGAEPVDLVVELSSDSGRVSVPATVTIPAGQTSARFQLSAEDDGLLNGSTTATLTAAAYGFAAASDSVAMTDYETLTVSVSPSTFAENAGADAATGTVTRSNTDIGQALLVTLNSGNTAKVLLPPSVTIPAGQATASFAVTAVDDAVLDGGQTVALGAAAAGYVGIPASVFVSDYEPLNVSFASSPVAEDVGSVQVTVTLPAMTGGLTVSLTSSDPTRLSVPATVQVADGQSQVSFNATVINDNLMNSDHTVTLTATATGYADGAADLTITNVTPTLQLGFRPAGTAGSYISGLEVLESAGAGSLEGILVRQGTSGVMTVTLASTDSRLSLPTTVSIPDGVNSATFAAGTLADGVVTGYAVATVTGSVGGSALGSSIVYVRETDNNAILYQESFETGASSWTFGGQWNLLANTAGAKISHDLTPRLVHLPDAGALPAAADGSVCAWFGQASTGTYVGSDFNRAQSSSTGGTSKVLSTGDLVSPVLDLSQTTRAYLTFSAWYEIESIAPEVFDSMQVLIKVDGGTPAMLGRGSINPLGGEAKHGTVPHSSGGVGQIGQWTSQIFDLSAYAGQSQSVQLVFRFSTGDVQYNGFRGWLIDQVTVYADLLAAPEITGCQPSLLDPETEHDAQLVQVQGSNFGNWDRLFINGTEITGIRVLNSSALAFYATPGTFSSYGNTIRVEHQNQLGDEAYNLLPTGQQPRPQITAISPSVATPAGGTTVTISGSGFLSGATVDVGSVAVPSASVTVVNDSTITFAVPAGLSEAYHNIRVSIPDSAFGPTLDAGALGTQYQSVESPAALRITSVSRSQFLSLTYGWNLVSVPFTLQVTAPATLFPGDTRTMKLLKTLDVGTAGRFRGISYQYLDASVLEPFIGYMVYVPESEGRIVLLEGSDNSATSIAAGPGYNMRGVKEEVTVAQLKAKLSSLFDVEGYTPNSVTGNGTFATLTDSTTLKPGLGYLFFIVDYTGGEGSTSLPIVP